MANDQVTVTSRQKENWLLRILVFLVLVVISYGPMIWLHEYAHGFGCVLDGLDFRVAFNESSCIPDLATFKSAIAGPIFSLAATAGFLTVHLVSRTMRVVHFGSLLASVATFVGHPFTFIGVVSSEKACLVDECKAAIVLQTGRMPATEVNEILESAGLVIIRDPLVAFLFGLTVVVALIVITSFQKSYLPKLDRWYLGLGTWLIALFMIAALGVIIPVMAEQLVR